MYKLWPLQFPPAFARDRKSLNRLKPPGVGQDEAVRKLRAHWSKLGFWPLGETEIYLLGMAQRGSGESRKDCETLAGPGVGLRTSLLERWSPTFSPESITHPLWGTDYFARYNFCLAAKLFDGHGHMFVLIFPLEGFDVLDKDRSRST
jgi:hypothetical protein